MPTNHLSQETSPYLLQHAHNPVDWYPWGEEAFGKARLENKPIFLSIGYSTCHWCHVMERESFESESVAAQLNENFVSIKIDREERPDLDRIYMSYVQATTGSGGWPMSVWLTPDLKPFVGGTYFPPGDMYGRPGFSRILDRIAAAWKQDRDNIIASSENVMVELRKQSAQEAQGPDHIPPTVSDACFQQFRRMFDPNLGGFGGAPKFPRPSIHHFLLRYWNRTGNEEALEMVQATLLAMEKGGMNDQLAGGFHRYSVDDAWFVPHFEKMLYDQAQLVTSYVEAYQATKEPVFAATARKTIGYVLHDMTSPGGAFYSAEDADSAPDPAQPKEKREGAFYVFNWKETFELLGSPNALYIAYRYGMESNGNVQQDPHGEFTGQNILFQAHTIEETAKYFDEPVEQVASALAEAEQQLLRFREQRPRPHLDDKILTSWNGLMISALAKAGSALGEPAYTEAANRAADFIVTNLMPNGRLLRRFRESAGIDGMLEDYAMWIQALLDLYESTFDAKRLAMAVTLQDQQSELFEDRESGGFFSSAHSDASALMRVKDDYDGAEPGGNSVALSNLLRLARITGNSAYESSARKLIAAYNRRITAAPHALPQMLGAIEFDLAPKREVILAGIDDPEVLSVLWSTFDPNRILLKADQALSHMRPEISAMQSPGIYVCEDFTCRQPVHTAAELSELIGNGLLK